MSPKKSDLAVFRFLSFYNVTDIYELVLPGVQRGKHIIGILHQLRNDAAGDRRDFLLTQRNKRDNAEVDRVAAGLLVIGDELVQRHVLARNKALGEPRRCGGGLRVGDMRVRQRSRGEEARRTT